MLRKLPSCWLLGCRNELLDLKAEAPDGGDESPPGVDGRKLCLPLARVGPEGRDAREGALRLIDGLRPIDGVERDME